MTSRPPSGWMELSIPGFPHVSRVLKVCRPQGRRAAAGEGRPVAYLCARVWVCLCLYSSSFQDRVIKGI